MSFTNIMFYSGSVLHEEDLEAISTVSEREVNRLLNPLDSEAPDYESKSQQAITEVNRITKTYSDKLAKILAEYNYRKYLRCVYKRLPNYMGTQSVSYLLNKTERNVLGHGRSEFYWDRAGSIWIREGDSDKAVDEKLSWRRPRHIGGFARTASIGTAGSYGFPAEVSFIKKNSALCHYDAIDAADVPAKIPTGYQLLKPNGNDSYSNSSSRVFKVEMDHFVKQMLGANLGFPVFSVSDCNSFHTSGYLWSTYAIRNVREQNADDAVVILNFDQHNDIGDVKDDLVASDRWGAQAVGYVKNGLYMSFGLAAKGGPGLNKNYAWQTVFVLRKNGTTPAKATNLNSCKTVTAGKAYGAMSEEEKLYYLMGILSSLKGRWNAVPNKPRDATLSGLAHGSSSGMHAAGGSPVDLAALQLGGVFTAFWKALSDFLGRPIKHVFITVDRDAVQGHQTQWGDESLFPNAGSLHYTVSSVVEALMAESPDCRIIGMDITGLPESRAAMNKWDTKLVPAAAAWQETEDEIMRLRAWGEQYVERQWKPAASPFLEKAIPLFNSLSKEVLHHDLLYGRNLPVDTRGKIAQLTTKLRSDQPTIALKPSALIAETEMRSVLTDVAKEMRLAAGRTFSREAKGVFSSYASRIERLLTG